MGHIDGHILTSTTKKFQMRPLSVSTTRNGLYFPFDYVHYWRKRRPISNDFTLSTEWWVESSEKWATNNAHWTTEPQQWNSESERWWQTVHLKVQCNWKHKYLRALPSCCVSLRCCCAKFQFHHKFRSNFESLISWIFFSARQTPQLAFYPHWRNLFSNFQLN